MVKAKTKGAAANRADVQAAANKLGNNAQVIMAGNEPIACYDTVYNGRHTFRLHKLYFGSTGQWLPGSCFMVPIEHRDAVLAELAAYAESVKPVEPVAA
jgi:hypothetical protein